MPYELDDRRRRQGRVRSCQIAARAAFASGGITTLTDVEALCAVEFEGITGAITGRAIYEGTLDFAAAQARADALNGAA